MHCCESLDVFSYLKPLHFFKALYDEARRKDPKYTHAAFSAELEIGSNNSHSILTGKRPLGPRVVESLITKLALPVKQARYLRLLMQYERASTPEESDRIFAQIIRQRTLSLRNTLTQNQLRFFAHWSNAVILELLRMDGASDDPEWIAAQLKVRITVPQVKQALNLLQELNYVKQCPERSRLFPTDELVTTGDQVYGIAIQGFHQQMMELALQSMKTVRSKEREISAVTAAVSTETREMMQAEIIRLRKKVIEASRRDKEKSELIQVNFQLFPLARFDKTEED